MTKQEDIKKKELIRKVTKFINENHRFPKRDELVSINCSAGKIEYAFGSLYNFERIIGKTHEIRKFSNGQVTNQMIIKEVNELYTKLGYPPHVKDYARGTTALNRFGGSWLNVLKACHIPATFEKGTLYSKEELIFRGRELAKKYGKQPTWRELQANHFPVNPMKHYWKSMDEFAKELDGLGFTINKNEKKYIHEKNLYIQSITTLLNDNKKITFETICSATGTTKMELQNFLDKEVKRGNLKHKSLAEFVLVNHGKDINNSSISINGTTYKSIYEAADRWGLSYDTLKKRINLLGNNHPLLTYSGLITKTALIKINGKTYPNISVAAKANNVNEQTLRERIIRYGNNSDKLFLDRYSPDLYDAYKE